MADSTLTLTIDSSHMVGELLCTIGRISVTASPDTYPTGGYTLSFAASQIKSQRPPKFVVVVGEAGFSYKFAPGTTNANGKLKVFTTGGGSGQAFAELAAGATPAGISGDTIRFMAFFLGMN